MAHPVVFFEVLGRDRTALRDFYREAFGWKTADIPGPMEYTTIEPGGEGGIAGGVGSDPSGGNGHVTFYVDTNDIDASLADVERLGGTRVMGPLDVPQGKIALFTDPEGHTVGLWSGDASS